MFVKPVRIARSQSDVCQVWTNPKVPEQRRLVAHIIARNGGTRSELLFDIRGKRARANLLGMARDAAIGCVDALARGGKARKWRRVHIARVLVDGGLQSAEIKVRVADNSQPRRDEDEENRKLLFKEMDRGEARRILTILKRWEDGRGAATQTKQSRAAQLQLDLANNRNTLKGLLIVLLDVYGCCRDKPAGKDDELAIVLISPDKESFYELRKMRNDLVEQMSKSGMI